MSKIPVNLYYIDKDSDIWRRTYLLIRDIFEGDIPKLNKSLDKRDLLPHYGIPIEAWIDLRILEKWFHNFVPIPVIALFNFLLKKQNSDGSFSIDGQLPNSGATYRTTELSLLLDLYDIPQIYKAIKFLISSLDNGGLASPGPIEGAVLEVGTTARFLHILYKFYLLVSANSAISEDITLAIDKMREFLISRAFLSKDEAAWHTDIPPSEIKDINWCITGATSLATYALVLLNRKEDKDLIEKACLWLIRRQKEDGGWSDSISGPSNVDNTFNVVRALVYASKLDFINPAIRQKILESLDKAKKYLVSYNPYSLKSTSLRAMLLRGRLLMLHPLDPKVLDSINALIDLKDKWYTPTAHIYNEILIAGIAISEWRKELLRNNIDPYDEDLHKYRGFQFLFSFPLEIPPFFPGFKQSLGDKILNFFIKKFPHKTFLNIFTRAFTESITLKDIISIFLAVILLFGFFFNEDFLKAIILPKSSNEINHNAFFVTLSIYIGWLFLKFKLRESFIHYISTTLISILLSTIIIYYWLRYGNDLVFKIIKEGNLYAQLRLILAFALLLDIGRRLINLSQIDRIFIHRR